MDCWSDDSQGVVDHENKKNMDASVMMFSYYLLLSSLELDKHSENVKLNTFFLETPFIRLLWCRLLGLSFDARLICAPLSPLFASTSCQTTTLSFGVESAQYISFHVPFRIYIPIF